MLLGRAVLITDGSRGLGAAIASTQMGERVLVMTGLAADLCLQFSAMHASVRSYRLCMPEDRTAAETPGRPRSAR